LKSADRQAHGPELLQLAERLTGRGVALPMLHEALRDRPLDRLLLLLRQAAFGTDIGNPGGWLRVALRRGAA
jgi:hypothetical protein